MILSWFVMDSLILKSRSFDEVVEDLLLEQTLDFRARTKPALIWSYFVSLLYNVYCYPDCVCGEKRVTVILSHLRASQRLTV